jgi:hypothetical protein
MSDSFYISDGIYCFVLSGDKLYQCHQLINSCRPYGGETLASFKDSGETYFLGVSDIIDFNIRTIKTITTIELGIADTGVYSVALDWRMNPTDAFVRTPFVPLNEAGVATLICAARDFRLCIRCEDYRDLKLDWATLRYKMGDNTSIRGIYAPPPRGQD